MRSKSKKPRKRKTGLPPGTIVYTGVHHDIPVTLDALSYDENGAEELSLASMERIRQLPDVQVDKILWLDLRGVHETELLTEIGKKYQIHPLALEDIADTHQRPKFDEYSGGLILIFPSLHWLGEPPEVSDEQISVYVTDHMVFSSQEKSEDLFEGVKKRILEGRGRIRMRKTDYLAYNLLDQAVDSYYHILDHLHEATEKLEQGLSSGQTSEIRQKIHYLKYEYLTIRKGLLPMREMISRLSRADHPFIHEESRPYFRDLFDHIQQVIEQLEIQREVLYGIQELHLSEISYQMNRVMKVLTIITTIFVPLTFLAGIYGMNFKYMPELEYPYSYPVLWVIMLIIVAGLLYFFKRKNWL